MARPKPRPTSPTPAPPIVNHHGRPAWIRAWRRDGLHGHWWALITWTSTRQFAYGEPRHEVVERWVSAVDIRPVEGQDYSRVPRMTEPLPMARA